MKIVENKSVPRTRSSEMPKFAVVHLPSALGGVETWIADLLSYSECVIATVPSRETGSPPDQAKKDPWALARLIRRAQSQLRKAESRGARAFLAHNFRSLLFLKFLRPSAKYVYISSNDFGRQLRGSSRLKRLLFSAVERVVATFASGVFSFSRRDLSRMQTFRNDVQWIPPSFNRRFLAVCPNRERRGVLWVGRLSEVKDPVLGLQAFIGSSHTHDEPMYIVGRGPLGGAIRELIARKNLSYTVSILSEVSDDDLLSLLGQCSVAVITSQAEAGSRFMLEALASGVKVVATEAADPEGIIGHTGGGVVVPSRNPLEIGKALSLELRQERAIDRTKLSEFQAERVVSGLDATLTALDI